MLAKNVNDNAYIQNERGVHEFFASKLAPTHTHTGLFQYFPCMKPRKINTKHPRRYRRLRGSYTRSICCIAPRSRTPLQSTSFVSARAVLNSVLVRASVDLERMFSDAMHDDKVLALHRHRHCHEPYSISDWLVRTEGSPSYDTCISYFGWLLIC